MYRYFITDKSNIGYLIIGKNNPKEMLIILGHLSLNTSDISEIVSKLVIRFNFTVEKKELSFARLNTDDETPYTYYNILEDGICPNDGYSYANIVDIRKHFKSKKSKAMLKSLRIKSVVDKKPFS